jgi:hypothetical protein
MSSTRIARGATQPVAAITHGALARRTRPPTVSITGADAEFPTARFAARACSSYTQPERPTPRAASPTRPRSCTVVAIPGSITSSVGTRSAPDPRGPSSGRMNKPHRVTGHHDRGWVTGDIKHCDIPCDR